MKQVATANYRRKITSLLDEIQIKRIDNVLVSSSNAELESLWHFIIAGYPVCFAVKHYKTLFNYLKEHSYTYEESLITYRIYPGLKTGIFIFKTRWFELN